jgi:hypothetical protein
MWGLWVSIDAEFSADSKNINLPYSEKRHPQKKLFQNKEFCLYTGVSKYLFILE